MKSSDPKSNVILEFTKTVLEKRGHIKDELIQKVKQKGFDDQDIVETIAMISLITQANYTANVGKPELDFLEPPSLEESGTRQEKLVNLLRCSVDKS